MALIRNPVTIVQEGGGGGNYGALPMPVSNISAKQAGKNNISVIWPKIDGSSGYKVVCKKGGLPTVEDIRSNGVNTNDTDYFFSNLEVNNEYGVWACSKDEADNLQTASVSSSKILVSVDPIVGGFAEILLPEGTNAACAYRTCFGDTFVSSTDSTVTGLWKLNKSTLLWEKIYEYGYNWGIDSYSVNDDVYMWCKNNSYTGLFKYNMEDDSLTQILSSYYNFTFSRFNGNIYFSAEGGYYCLFDKNTNTVTILKSSTYISASHLKKGIILSANSSSAVTAQKNIRYFDPETKTTTTLVSGTIYSNTRSSYVTSTGKAYFKFSSTLYFIDEDAKTATSVGTAALATVCSDGYLLVARSNTNAAFIDGANVLEEIVVTSETSGTSVSNLVHIDDRKFLFLTATSGSFSTSYYLYYYDGEIGTRIASSASYQVWSLNKANGEILLFIRNQDGYSTSGSCYAAIWDRNTEQMKTLFSVARSGTNRMNYFGCIAGRWFIQYNGSLRRINMSDLTSTTLETVGSSNTSSLSKWEDADNIYFADNIGSTTKYIYKYKKENDSGEFLAKYAGLQFGSLEQAPLFVNNTQKLVSNISDSYSIKYDNYSTQSLTNNGYAVMKDTVSNMVLVNGFYNELEIESNEYGWTAIIAGYTTEANTYGQTGILTYGG